MKKWITFVLLFSVLIVLSACKPVNPDDVNCLVTPEHEDCVEIDPCDENPDLPECNIVYTYEDTYDLLEFDNDQVDDFDTVFNMMNNLVNVSVDLYNVGGEFEFFNFYNTQVNSAEGLTKEELIGYQHPEDILLKGIDAINFSVSGEVSRFSIYLQDGDFVESEFAEQDLPNDYLGRSYLTVNEDGFQYIYEMINKNEPDDVVSYYELTLRIVSNRLVFEHVKYADVQDQGFDYSYIIYDSKVGFVVKDLRFYNENLFYYENQVDLENRTAESKQINLGGYRTYQYSRFDYDEGIAYTKFQSRSRINQHFVVDEVSFYDGYNEVVSLTKSFELVLTGHIPTEYQLNYNIAYLNDWDAVHGDYLVKNNNEIAFITTKGAQTVSVIGLDVEQLFDDMPSESDLTDPYNGITFSEVSYDDLAYEMNRIYAMDAVVYYEDNIASVEDVDYDIRTDLLDLFLSDLPQIVYDNVTDHMIVDQIIFGGEDELIELIDCEVTPEHELCPDS